MLEPILLNHQPALAQFVKTAQTCHNTLCHRIHFDTGKPVRSFIKRAHPPNTAEPLQLKDFTDSSALKRPRILFGTAGATMTILPCARYKLQPLHCH